MNLVWEFILQGMYRQHGIPYPHLLTDYVSFDLPKHSKVLDMNGKDLVQQAVKHLDSHSMIEWATDPHNGEILTQIADGIIERSGGTYSPKDFAKWMTYTATNVPVEQCVDTCA